MLFMSKLETVSVQTEGEFLTVNLEHHDWATVQVLQFSVLDFCCLQVKILILKNGFVIYFLMKTSFAFWRTVMQNKFTFHKTFFL